MAVELKQFIKRLTDATLMSADEVRAFLDRLPPDEQPRTGKELAEQLVRHKRLTAFQARAVYDGKGEGLVLGSYVILERIGQGGMGTVYKAQHREMKRVVAIKVLAPHLTKTPEGLKRFQREVRAAAALNHPNIVTAYDAAESKGARYLVMEYVDGADLASVVKNHRAATRQPGRPVRAASRPGSGIRPFKRHHSPRHQTVQSAGRSSRQRQDLGSRAGSNPRSGRLDEHRFQPDRADQDGDGPGHG